jgi:hypothetical protein
LPLNLSEMAKGQKVKEIAGRLVVEFIKIWLCGRPYRLPKTPEVLAVIENSATDVEALKSLKLEEGEND